MKFIAKYTSKGDCYNINVFTEETHKKYQKITSTDFVELFEAYDVSCELFSEEELNNMLKYEHLWCQTYIFHGSESILCELDMLQSDFRFAKFEKLTVSNYLTLFQNVRNQEYSQVFIINDKKILEKEFINDCVYLDDIGDEVVSPELFFNGKTINATPVEPGMMLTTEEREYSLKDNKNLKVLKRKKLIQKIRKK